MAKPLNVARAHKRGWRVSVECGGCGHAADANLAELRRQGRGGQDMLALRWRCSVCNGRDAEITLDRSAEPGARERAPGAIAY